MRREVIVSLCQSTPAGSGREYPGQVQPGVTPARSGWGYPSQGAPVQGTPGQVRMGGTSARGHPPRIPQPVGCPPGTPGQVRMGDRYPNQEGTCLGYPKPGQDGGYPSQGGASPGYSPPRDRTAHGVLDTPQSVCLLRSRRRTFLLSCVDLLPPM